MELPFMRQEALDKLSKDFQKNIEYYACENVVWIDEYFVREQIKVPVISSEIEIPDFTLIESPEPACDIENAIILHSVLRDKINPVQATDRRLWIMLTHSTCYSYMKSRWKVENKLNDKGTNGTVTDRYFMSRGFFRNGISRLYWLAELTYDESLDDPYEYTRYLMREQDLLNQIDGRSFCRNRMILLSALKKLKEAEPLTRNQRRLYFENLCKRGGVTVLDALSKDVLESNCGEVLEEVIQLKQIESGSRITVQANDSKKRVQFEIKDGKVFLGKNVFRSKPESLYGFTIGKEVEIGKIKYIIVHIE